ncbi:MAG: hypothetical protein KKA31_05605 [Candidatus Margulisbacteria bacterium]|nr:hypothetical protein [Candidatus Margulisiibacteriota bacterium]
MQSHGTKQLPIERRSRGDYVLWELSRRAAKSFYPGSRIKLPKYSFQNCLSNVLGKIAFSIRLLVNYGLADITFLGGPPHDRIPVVQYTVPDLSKYLYETVIHPRFFADTVHLIGTYAETLKPRLDLVNLRNLRREQIENAITDKKIKPKQLDQWFGHDFSKFAKLPEQQRIKILEILGVLVLKEGASLPLFPDLPQKRGRKAQVLADSVVNRRRTSPPKPKQLSLLAVLARKTLGIG